MIDIDDAELSRVLAETLRSRAEPVTVPTDGEFDPTRRAAWAGHVEPARRPQARPRARAVVAAAAAVAVVAGVAAVVQSSGTGGGGVTVGPEAQPAPGSVVPSVPEGVLAPTFPPGGLDLWAVSWSRQADGLAVSPFLGVTPQWAQLFGDPGDAERLLLVEAHTSPEALASASSAQEGSVAVRGHQGTVSEPLYQDGAFGVRAVHWGEGGLWYSATFKAMTSDEAVAALDGLQLRPDGARGFGAPADGSSTLLEEVLEPSPPETPTGRFTYAEAAPSSTDFEGRAVQVLTGPGSGGRTFAYLRTWVNGTRHADGTVTSYLAGSPSILSVVRPDGTEISVRGRGTGVAPAVAEQVAASVQPTTAPQLGALWAEANGRVASLPLIAEVQLPSGAVQVRGDEGEPRALCLEVEAGIACPDIGTDPGVVEPGTLVAGLTLGAAWYVAGATTGTPPDVEGGGGAVETGSDGTWNVALSRPDEDRDWVSVVFDGGDHAMDLQRP